MIAGAQARPFRTVVAWQMVATAVLMAVSAGLAGMVGAVSAALGGTVALAGSLAYILLLPRSTEATTVLTPWDTLSSVLRAEGAKIGVMVVLLWLVMTFYKQIVVVGFIGTFTVAVIIFSMAIFVRKPASLEMDKSNVG